MPRVFRGLIYVKHGRIGTKSEGPDYFLQTVEGDHLLVKDSFPWAPDDRLELYQRRMVEIRGELVEVNGEPGAPTHAIRIEEITEISSPTLPQDGEE